MIDFWFFDAELKVVICDNFQNYSAAVFVEELSDWVGNGSFFAEEPGLPVVFHEFGQTNNGTVEQSFDHFIVYEIFLYPFLDVAEHFPGGLFFFFVLASLLHAF